MPIYALGHKIPDTDSFVSAISLAYLKTQLGEETLAVAQGKPSPETQFILEHFELETPAEKHSFAGEKVYLADYSDKAQGPDDLDQAIILGIVDHHKLGDITTQAPLECWIRPVGCSNTIIKEMYDFHKVAIPAKIAGAMLCAILSDTVIFKSPTCTPVDIKAVEELALIAGIADYKALGLELFKVKSAVDGTPVRDLVLRDFKDFDMSGNKVGIGQLEVVDLSVFDQIKADLQADIQALKEEGQRHTVMLLLTDIMQEGSELLIVSDDAELSEKAFAAKAVEGKAWLDGVLSRKKQVVPPLEKAFA